MVVGSSPTVGEFALLAHPSTGHAPNIERLIPALRGPSVLGSDAWLIFLHLAHFACHLQVLLQIQMLLVHMGVSKWLAVSP